MKTIEINYLIVSKNGGPPHHHGFQYFAPTAVAELAPISHLASPRSSAIQPEDLKPARIGWNRNRTVTQQPGRIEQKKAKIRDEKTQNPHSAM